MNLLNQWKKIGGSAFCMVSPFFAQALADTPGINCETAKGRPSEVRDRNCAEQPEMRVCVMNRGGNGESLPLIELEYRGYLQAPEYQSVVAFVRLNGKSGFYHLKKSEDGRKSVALLGMPMVEYKCVVEGNGNPESLPVCPAGTPGSAGEVTWYFEGPPDDEQVLFQNIRDADGNPQKWVIDFAFASVDGRHWDSKYGRNYVFSFDALPRELPPEHRAPTP